MSPLALLAAIPAATEPATVESWAASKVAQVQQSSFQPVEPSGFVGVDAEPLRYNEGALSQFINAALLVDWVCYSLPADRVDYAHLHAIIATFPIGFRVWLCRSLSGPFLPVAYTGWYPLDRVVFRRVVDQPAQITDRKQLWPKERLSEGGDYFWLFNYSIVAQLRKSPQSRLMLQTYATDLARHEVLGLAAAVISEESKKVVQRFGMTYRGDMTHEGVLENVYAVEH